MDSSELNEIFSNGDEEELNQAINIYGQPILRYCHNILCNYFDAQDAIQETFIKAYNKRKQFVNGTSLSSWLYRIAYTTCIDILRKKRFMIFEQRKDCDNQYISDELKSALLRLSAKERALIFNRVIDEKDYSELEGIYNVSAATLRKRYERAKNKLAKILVENKYYHLRLEEQNER